MRSLLIVGAGEYGQMVKELAESIGYEKIDFLDDNNEIAVGKIEDLEKIQDSYTECICAVGNNNFRKEVLNRITNKATIISKDAVVYDTAIIGKGCIIEAGTVISTDAVVDEGCLICAGAIINHNSRVNKYCQVDCNAVVKGVVPEGTKVECCTLWK